MNSDNKRLKGYRKEEKKRREEGEEALNGYIGDASMMDHDVFYSERMIYE